MSAFSLERLLAGGSVPEQKRHPFLEETNELIAIFVTSINTADKRCKR
jgi:hypothetical protein